MAGKKKGIRICREKGRIGRQKRMFGWGELLTAFFTACLACAWWAGILSVFPIVLSLAWLYGVIVLLSATCAFILCCMGKWAAVPLFAAAGVFLWFLREAVLTVFLPGAGADEQSAGITAAVMTLPLLWLWVLVLKSGRGKLAAGLLMAVPFIITAWAGFLPSMSASWLLFGAGGMYYAFLASGRPDSTASGSALLERRRVPHALQAFCTVACTFAFLAGISVFLGKYLDEGREEENGFYQSTRAWIHADLIGGVQRFIEEMNKGGEEAVGMSEDQPETEQLEEGEDMGEEEPSDIAGVPDMEQEGESFGEALATGSSMSDLKAVSSFVPDDEAAMDVVCILPEKPTETVYYPLRNGIIYTDDSWTESEAGASEEASLTSSEKSVYTDYPSDLARMEALCEDWDTSSLKRVAEQTDRTLSSMAVYDTDPGATPDGQNFPEYFLFENQKGFCVHFATTATLFYRMCGYSARYAEGYAIPPSAFRDIGGGRYEAVADGSMGHAWCQVFDEEQGKWLDMEHTPPASGVVPKSNGGILDSVRESGGAGAVRESLMISGFILAGILVFVGIMALQASVRRKRLREKLRYHADGSGILALYDVILCTAQLEKGILTDKENKNRLSESTLDILKNSYPQIQPEEWDQLYDQVMRGMFDRPADTEERRREWERSLQLFSVFAETAKESMGKWKRMAYRYVYCLDVLP